MWSFMLDWASSDLHSAQSLRCVVRVTEIIKRRDGRNMINHPYYLVVLIKIVN